MKLQDQFPNDAAIKKLQGLYHKIGTDSFYINHPCIMVKDHIITEGETYFLFQREYDKNKIHFRTVSLIDTFFYKEILYLILNDLNLDEIIYLNFVLKNLHEECQWKLFDLNILKKILLEKEKEFNRKDSSNDNELS